MKWLLLILGLPTANATERMRAWRALKACGASVLRDGVYLLPEHEEGRTAFEAIERDVLAINGTAFVLAQAAAVAVLAELEFVGLKRMAS